MWALQVVAGPLSPPHCVAGGLGLRGAAAGVPQEFTVSLRDAWGNACGWDSSAVSVQAFWLDSDPVNAWSGAGQVAISQCSEFGNETITYMTHKVCPLSVFTWPLQPCCACTGLLSACSACSLLVPEDCPDAG